MSSRLEGLNSELEAVRAEITELDAVENPTDEQAARYGELITQWDDLKVARDDEAARQEKLDAIRKIGRAHV